MDLKILEKKDNKLLSRTEIKAEANFFGEPTPKLEQIRKKISELEKVNEALIVVKEIKGMFGEAKAHVLVYVYSDEDQLRKIEPREKKPKEGAAEEKPKEQAEKPSDKKEEKKSKEESGKEEKAEES